MPTSPPSVPRSDGVATAPRANVAVAPPDGDTATPQDPPPNPYDAAPTELLSLDAMSGEEIARRLADRRVADAAPTGDGLPRPRSADDNNPFALVRTSGDLAHDSTPVVVSHDGKRMAFLPTTDFQQRVIWVANVDGENARQVVDLYSSFARFPDGKTAPIPSEQLFSPSFSADGRTLFFQTDGWVTSLALYAVDLKSGAIRFVTDANGYEVIGECRDASLVGSIITYRHSYSEMDLSAVDWYFLHDKNGKSRGAIGPTEENVERFLINRCGAPVVPEQVPAFMKQRPGCGDFVVLYRPKHFLDGTELPVFFHVAKEDANRPFESLGTEERGPALELEQSRALLREHCGIE